MIISASRRTDIPAFYSDWFMGRTREGFFHRVNPFNSKQVSAFSLKPEHLEAICFWTKNPKPLMQHLDELDRQGYNYYFQFTLNPLSSARFIFQWLRQTYFPVWRSTGFLLVRN